MEDEQFQLRFRHHDGDVGPFLFKASTTIAEIKDKIISEWPKEGLLTKYNPQTSDIKMILSGKYVESAKPLRDYKKDMGDVKPDTIVTLHLVIRPQQTATAKQQAGSGPAPEKAEAKGCGCIIS